MEIKQVIKRLASCSIIPFGADAEEISSMSIAALEKQMPKKVAIESGKWPDGRKRISHYCPSCLNELYANQAFCDECGQRLDWSENDG